MPSLRAPATSQSRWFSRVRPKWPSRCHPTAVNHATECTVPPFARIAVGSSVSATLKGGTAQVITVFPEACGQPGTPPAATVTYTIRADFPG
jgi:hypothetical protein